MMDRSSKEIAAEWQGCLETIWATPPNEAHFAAVARINELDPEYRAAVEREQLEEIAAAEKRAADKLLITQSVGGPDLAQVMQEARARVQTLTGLIGATATQEFCERAISDRVADDTFTYLG